VYNSETYIVEESIHIKFDDKEPNNKILELVESFVDKHISKMHQKLYKHLDQLLKSQNLMVYLKY
jgi:hypothetical protein